jgi:LL-diaminopimelate aminotransferase
VREQFKERRDRALDIVKRMGLGCVRPEATFYLWVNVPGSWKSMDFALMLLEKADVLVTPGTGFGSSGEGYFRMALTCSLARLEEAGERMMKAVRTLDV